MPACTISKREFHLITSGVIQPHCLRESQCFGFKREPAIMQTPPKVTSNPNIDVIQNDIELDTKQVFSSIPTIRRLRLTLVPMAANSFTLFLLDICNKTDDELRFINFLQ